MYQLQTCFYYYYSLSPDLMSCSLFTILVVFTRDNYAIICKYNHLHLVYLARKTLHESSLKATVQVVFS